MKSYIFIEAKDRLAAEQAVIGIPYARGLLRHELPVQEIENLIKPEKMEVNIIKNDIVEIIAKPFLGEKAKVVRVDKDKHQVVVELLDALAPMPITLSIDNVRVIRRESSTDVVENK